MFGAVHMIFGPPNLNNMHIDFKKAFHRAQSSGIAEGDSHEFMHLMRDWMSILGVSVLILILGVAYSAFDFYTQFGESSTGAPVPEKHIRYRDKEIVSFSDIYVEKEKAFNALRADAPPAPESVATPATTTVDMEIGEGEPLAEEEAPLYTEGAVTPL